MALPDTVDFEAIYLLNTTLAEIFTSEPLVKLESKLRAGNFVVGLQ